jgi:hypothetical protein
MWNADPLGAGRPERNAASAVSRPEEASANDRSGQRARSRLCARRFYRDILEIGQPARSRGRRGDPGMTMIRGLRWWIVALICLGTIINYLSRNALGVLAPTLKNEMGVST